MHKYVLCFEMSSMRRSKQCPGLYLYDLPVLYIGFAGWDLYDTALSGTSIYHQYFITYVGILVGYLFQRQITRGDLTDVTWPDRQPSTYLRSLHYSFSIFSTRFLDLRLTSRKHAAHASRIVSLQEN